MAADPRQTKLADDQRLKNLFAELGQQLAEKDKQPAPVEAEFIPVTRNEPAEPLVPKVEISACPYVRAGWDQAVRYQYPCGENWCYRSKKARPVSLDQQENVCYAGQWQECPVNLKAMGKGKLRTFFRNIFK